MESYHAAVSKKWHTTRWLSTSEDQHHFFTLTRFCMDWLSFSSLFDFRQLRFSDFGSNEPIHANMRGLKSNNQSGWKISAFE